MKAVYAGFPDRLFKYHGRWKSDVKDSYVKDSAGRQLTVLLGIGL